MALFLYSETNVLGKENECKSIGWHIQLSRQCGSNSCYPQMNYIFLRYSLFGLDNKYSWIKNTYKLVFRKIPIPFFLKIIDFVFLYCK